MISDKMYDFRQTKSDQQNKVQQKIIKLKIP